VCAKRSAYESAGENPARVKCSQQPVTELYIQGGDELDEARARDAIGCNESECVEPRKCVIVEVDVIFATENNTTETGKVREQWLHRGPRQWHVARWLVCELGRSTKLFRKKYIETSREDEDRWIV